jgi:ATP-dependent helicase/DNAse subunit B
MPLTLVLGPANSAKAGEVLGAYTLAATRDALLVVPTAADVEHYERELTDSGVTLGRALTFPGLLDEIGLRAGYRRSRLTALQRQRVLRRAIAGLQLASLAGSSEGRGFAPAAGRLIAELEQRRITPQRFAAALREWSGGASARIAFTRDVAAIYRAYRGELESLELLDDELFAWGALDALRARPSDWGATPVFLYGFDDLTPIELDAVDTLSRLAQAAVTVSLTYEPDRPALAARATVVEELRAGADAVRQLPPLDDHYALGSRVALHQLERGLFEPGVPTVEPGDAIVLMEAGGERAEAELVATEVLSALTAGVPAGEIVVVCRSLSRSAELLERALERHGVAVTSRRRMPLSHTGLGRCLLALVRSALLPLEQRSVGDLIAYLRHPGLVDRVEAVDRLEAELRRGGVRSVEGAGFARAMALAAGPESSDGAAELRAALEAVHRLREETEPITVLTDHVRLLLAAPHRGRARLLGSAQELDARAASAVISALAEIQQLDGARVPAVELIELLDGVQVAAHGLPASAAVLVAEPLAIRARRFRRVFVTGLCEGEFPSPQTSSGDPFLGDERRFELAMASGVALPQSPDPLDRERYLLYACLSRATERVTLSYRSSDEDGNLVIPSPFLDDIAELFAEGWRERRRRMLLGDVVETGGPGSPASDPGSAAGPVTRTLSQAALAHVRHRQVVSAGGLELFGACPVKWLIERQLRIRDLEPEPEPLTRGSFIHAVLERVFAQLDGGLTPDSLPGAERLLGEAIRGSDVAAERRRVASGQSPEVRAAVLGGIEAELRRYLSDESTDGSRFLPTRTELRFGLDPDSADALGPVTLGGDSDQVMLSGVIDRIDSDPADPQNVIVRDYKSGAKRDTWPAARWVSDRQIQVALYMIAVQRLLGVRPVAGFYQPLAGEDRRPRGAYESGVAAGDRVVPRDELGEGQLEQLLREIEADAVALAVTLRRGELTPCPDSCAPNGSCSHPGICWAEAI